MERIVSETRSLGRVRSKIGAGVVPGALVLSWLGAALCACGPGGINTGIFIETPGLKAGERVVEYQHGGQLFALKNGMRMLVLPDGGTNVVKVEMRYQTGSMSDPADRAGLAHLLEHLTFTIPASEGGSATIADSLGQIALSHNAFTTWDYTTYLSFGQRDQLPNLLALEARRMRAGCEQLGDAQLAREREVVRNEVRQRATFGKQVFDRLFRDAYGAEHPYGRPIAGSDGQLVAITRAELCAFMDLHYQPGNAILVLSGDVPVDLARKHFSKKFSRIPGQKVTDRPRIAVPALRGQSSQMAMPSAEAVAMIAYNAPGFDHPDSGYERLARYLLRRRMSEILRKDRDITGLSVGAIGGDRAPLTVLIVSVADPAKLRAATDRVKRQTNYLLKGVDANVLGYSRERARGQFMRHLEPFGAEAALFADYLQYADHLEFATAELGKFNTMKRSEFARYLESRYRAADSHTLYVTTTRDAPLSTRTAGLSLSAGNLDLPDWHARVDVAEADRDLPVPNVDLRPSVKTFQLDNGLTVIAAPGLGHPVVDIRLVFRGGTLHEPPGQAGVAELAAALVEPHPEREYRTRVDLQTMNKVRQAIFRMGGEVVSSVDELTTTFKISGLSMYADGLLYELYEHVHDHDFYDRKQLRAIRDIAVRSKDRGADARARRRTVLERLYGAGHRYARVESPAAVFERVTRKDLARFRKAHYHAEGATLIITGEFDADFLLPQVRRLFGSLPRRAPAAQQPVAPVAGRPGASYVGIIAPGAAQLRIEISFATAAGVASDHAERLLIRQMLHLEMGALREQFGSTYGVRVSDVRRVGPGMLTITADVDGQRASESYRAMQTVLKRLRAGDDSVIASFVRARRAVLQDLLSDSVNSRSLANEHEVLVTHGLDSQYFSQLARRVAGMRLAQVKTVIARDLAVERSVVMLSGERAIVQGMLGELGVEPTVIER